MTVLLRRWWTRGRRQVRRVVRLIGRPFRRSVQLRLLATAISISVISLALLTVYLSVAMRDGLVDRRVEEILSESARSLSQTQTTVNSSTASSSSGVQQTLNDLLPALQSGGTSGREVFLLRSATNTSSVRVLDLSTAPDAEGIISDALRQAVAQEPQQQHWQSVRLESGSRVLWWAQLLRCHWLERLMSIFCIPLPRNKKH